MAHRTPCCPVRWWLGDPIEAWGQWEDSILHYSTCKWWARGILTYVTVSTRMWYTIIVGVHELNYIAVPSCAHEDKGIREMSTSAWVCFCARRTLLETCLQIPILVWVYSRSRYGPLTTKSPPAHFANPIAKNYYSVISYCGDLTDESAKRLGQLMKHEMERGLKDWLYQKLGVLLDQFHVYRVSRLEKQSFIPEAMPKRKAASSIPQN